MVFKINPFNPNSTVSTNLFAGRKAQIWKVIGKLEQVKNAADRMRLEYVLLGSRMSLEERRRFDAYCVVDAVDD